MTIPNVPFVLACFLGLAETVPDANAAIDIRFDYTYDNGFFSGANSFRRSVLDAAIQSIEGRLVEDSLPSILPSGSNTWTFSIDDPRNIGKKVAITNFRAESNTVTIFVGGASVGPLAYANISNISFAGGSQWQNTNINRVNSSTNFDAIGGGIIFNSAVNWYFGADESPLPTGKFDFFSVAAHEVFHILGFGFSNAFVQDMASGFYKGTNVQATAGGPVALTADWHWANNVRFNGEIPLMNPIFSAGERRVATELDYAVLKDIGYTVAAAPVPESATFAYFALGIVLLFANRRRLLAHSGSSHTSTADRKVLAPSQPQALDHET